MGFLKSIPKPVILAVLPQVILLSLLTWFVWVVDMWTGMSLQFPGYIVIAVVTLSLLCLPFCLVRRVPVMVIPGVWLFFLIALPFVANSSIKPLLWGVRDLEQGMEREAVLHTLNRRYAGSTFSEPVVFREDETVICLRPQGRDPGFQAESLLVYLSDGRFSHAHFSAD
ncbi:MAG: hypothetical protein P1U89_11355 [Verrucomicrobiales bacterium]|nr:hypothetical protein [Verrucomicrobiales bacterium]